MSRVMNRIRNSGQHTTTSKQTTVRHSNYHTPFRSSKDWSFFIASLYFNIYYSPFSILAEVYYVYYAVKGRTGRIPRTLGLWIAVTNPQRHTHTQPRTHRQIRIKTLPRRQPSPQPLRNRTVPQFRSTALRLQLCGATERTKQNRKPFLHARTQLHRQPHRNTPRTHLPKFKINQIHETRSAQSLPQTRSKQTIHKITTKTNHQPLVNRTQKTELRNHLTNHTKSNGRQNLQHSNRLNR